MQYSHSASKAYLCWWQKYITLVESRHDEIIHTLHPSSSLQPLQTGQQIQMGVGTLITVAEPPPGLVRVQSHPPRLSMVPGTVNQAMNISGSNPTLVASPLLTPQRGIRPTLATTSPLLLGQQGSQRMTPPCGIGSPQQTFQQTLQPAQLARSPILVPARAMVSPLLVPHPAGSSGHTFLLDIVLTSILILSPCNPVTGLTPQLNAFNLNKPQISPHSSPYLLSQQRNNINSLDGDTNHFLGPSRAGYSANRQRSSGVTTVKAIPIALSPKLGPMGSKKSNRWKEVRSKPTDKSKKRYKSSQWH